MWGNGKVQGILYIKFVAKIEIHDSKRDENIRVTSRNHIILPAITKNANNYSAFGHNGRMQDNKDKKTPKYVHDGSVNERQRSSNEQKSSWVLDQK